MKLWEINNLFSSLDEIAIVDFDTDDVIVCATGGKLDDFDEVPEWVQEMEIVLIKSHYARERMDIEIVLERVDDDE